MAVDIMSENGSCGPVAARSCWSNRSAKDFLKMHSVVFQEILHSNFGFTEKPGKSNFRYCVVLSTAAFEHVLLQYEWCFG